MHLSGHSFVAWGETGYILSPRMLNQAFLPVSIEISPLVLVTHGCRNVGRVVLDPSLPFPPSGRELKVL